VSRATIWNETIPDPDARSAGRRGDDLVVLAAALPRLWAYDSRVTVPDTVLRTSGSDLARF
jgi:hypothetical protein